MKPRFRAWYGILLVAFLALALTWHFDSVFGQQGGAGGAGGGAGGRGGAGGIGPGGRGGAGGVGGGLIAAGSPGSVSATSDFVYVVHNDTLYQFSAQDLALMNRVPLTPAPQGAVAPRRLR